MNQDWTTGVNGTGRDKAAAQTAPHDYAHPDPAADAALDWFLKTQQGTLSKEEQAAFRDWLEEAPHHGQEYDKLQSLWHSNELASALADAPAVMDLSAVREARRKRRRWQMPLAAAAVLLFAATPFLGPRLWIALAADYVTATGRQQTVSLPDGSTVHLNTASAIALDFANGKRGVRLLQGEAYFNVIHDETRPFTVTSRFGEVTVRGTAFSVETASDADTVFLERGKVEVSCLCAKGGTAVLAPGEEITATGTELGAVQTADAGQELAWRSGRISFTGQPLGKVLGELARYHSGTIISADSRLGRLTVSGNYRLDDVEGAVRSLAEAAGVSVTSLPGGILILR